jgi:SAM-dependent methyltransferase
MDSICEKDLSSAVLSVSQDPGRVSFRHTDGITLPFFSGEVDAVYCISVVEHSPDFDILLNEIHRILKPGGIFLLTFDLDLRGDHEIGPLKYRRLKDTIKELFSTREHEMTIHPVDLLTSSNSSYPIPVQSFHLAVEGQILTRDDKVH